MTKKSEQRNEIIRLIRGLKDVLKDSPTGIKRSDLDDMNGEIKILRDQITQCENRIEFMERKKDQMENLIRIDIRKIILEELNGRPREVLIRPFWRRIFRRREVCPV